MKNFNEWLLQTLTNRNDERIYEEFLRLRNNLDQENQPKLKLYIRLVTLKHTCTDGLLDRWRYPKSNKLIKMTLKQQGLSWL
ncbi:hypothetical protein DC58_16330 [Vibrio navarrensis]|nr:hypothetical protein DC58_16330 [Vibrio navarrensis]